MKLFKLHREVDDSGVSGTGYVAEGVEFDDGQCVISWLTGYHTLGIYPDVNTLMAIHGHGGHTKLEWCNEG